MSDFEIVMLTTHAQVSADLSHSEQWAEITLKVPKDFDWKANSAGLIKKLQAATNLIGKAG